jgi:hypothetical protein
MMRRESVSKDVQTLILIMNRPDLQRTATKLLESLSILVLTNLQGKSVNPCDTLLDL